MSAGLGELRGFRSQLDHLAVDPQHPFRARLVGQRESGAVGISYHLGHAIMVAQINEQNPAMVAHAVNPAGKADGLTGIFSAELAAIMGAIGVHRLDSRNT